MSVRKIKAEKPASLFKTGVTFLDVNKTEWTVIVSAGDGTAAVESENDAGEYASGFVYISEEGETYGANGVPEFIVRNSSWYKNDTLDNKEEKIVVKKRAAFRKKKL